MSIAVIIIAFNEQKHIKAAIESAAQVSDEILVIDSGSTDDTVAISEACGARVVFRAWDDDFSAQRNFAAQNTDADWLLHLDADERITPELAQEIKNVDLTAKKIFCMKRQNVFFGQLFKYGVYRPDKIKRLYPKDDAKWSGKVHEDLKSSLPEQLLAGALLHYPYDNWEQYFTKFNKYTTIWAEDAFAKEKKTNVFGVFSHAAFSFLKVSFLNFGILDGFMGWITCLLHFFYTMMKYLKLYQLQEQKRR